MVNRHDIIIEARSWLGTRFHHQGRVKKNSKDNGGVDCIGLIIGVCENIGATYHGKSFSNFDKRDYAKIPNGMQLKSEFSRYLKEINPDDAESGDVLMFRFDKEPQHVAFVAKEGAKKNIIHCYMQARRVVEHNLDEYWKKRIVAAYSFLD